MKKEKVELVIKASALQGLINAVYERICDMTNSELEEIFGGDTRAYFVLSEIEDGLRALESWLYKICEENDYTDFDDDIADGFADELHSIANLPDSEIALPLITLINHLLYFAQDALKVAYNTDSLEEDEELEALRDEAHTNLINIQWRLEDNAKAKENE